MVQLATWMVNFAMQMVRVAKNYALFIISFSECTFVVTE